ncbi:MAG: YkgJ family cysteine cluster protein [Candidatus Magnetomorum sp.]|nr:YkgJ family cysteine cluster protein [Candidatus Magnetomorum sp.]
MSMIQKIGFEFAFDPRACKNCSGYCCCGESGKIWVNQQEMLQLCTFFNINIIDFTQSCLDRFDNRFSIKERLTENGFECIFFDSIQKKCSIYTVRPLQCRHYPFWKDTDQALNECPGIHFLKEPVNLDQAFFETTLQYMHS